MPANTNSDPNSPGNSIHHLAAPVTSATAPRPFLASSNPTSNNKPTLELITSVMRMVETLSVMRTISRFCTTSPIPAAISSNSIFIALSPGISARAASPARRASAAGTSDPAIGRIWRPLVPCAPRRETPAPDAA